MAETGVLDSEEEGVTLEEKHLPASEEAYERVLYTSRGEDRADESSSVIQPLLQHKYEDSRDENHKADTQTAAAGTDGETSAPQEPELAVRDQRDGTGSVGSLCSSSSSRSECLICSEQFDTHGDHRITLLNCDHTLCHSCTAGIMRRAKEPGRLRCPFCRQTTPFPQWEIRRLQEDSYGGGVYEGGLALIIGPGPELQAVPVRRPERQQESQTHADTRRCCVYPSCLVRGLRLMQTHSLCFSFTVLLLLFLICWATLCIFIPLIILSKLIGNG